VGFRGALGSLSLAAAFFLTLAGCVRPGGEKPLRVGFMICNSVAETRARFAPLAAHLAEQLGRRVEPVWLDTADFDEAIRAGRFDLIHTNSYLYAWFHEAYGFRVLAGEERGRDRAYSSGAIIAGRDSGVKSLADLKGKRFVFGPPFAPTAYLSQYWLLLRPGSTPKRTSGITFPPGLTSAESDLRGGQRRLRRGPGRRSIWR
jgi:phosphonate transport system substrate-binding protein